MPQPGAAHLAGASRCKDPALAVEDVTKRFGAGVTAVDCANFGAPAGRFVSLVGPSGCGKSTLLRLIAGLLPASEGIVRIHGDVVTGPRQDVGVMFQTPTLLPWKTSLENVLLPTRLRGEARSQAEDRARDLLHTVGLDGFIHTYPAHLSGGMQQRVSLARLLMLGTDVLLLDEPFGALDEFTRERLNTELLDIHRRLTPTVVFVTHNITEAVYLSDLVVVMTPGPGKVARLVEVPFDRARPTELMREPAFADLVFEIRAAFEEAA